LSGPEEKIAKKVVVNQKNLDDDDSEQKELLHLFVFVTMNDVHDDSVAISTPVATARQRHRLTQIDTD
jgi:hypothetical protein